jgi:transposase
VNGGGGAVGVWGCMSGNGTGCAKIYEGTINADNYIDILGSYLIPSTHLLCNGQYIYQQDNASIHRANKVKEWFRIHDVRVMNWPPYSPDLNPIEYLWHVIDLRLRKFQFSNLVEFKEAVHKSWLSLSASLCHKLVATMTERCRRCIAAKGGHFKCVSFN